MREKGTTNKQPTIGGGDLADCWLEERSRLAVGTRRRIERRGRERGEYRKSQENLHISKKSSTFAGANVLGKEKESKDK